MYLSQILLAFTSITDICRSYTQGHGERGRDTERDIERETERNTRTHTRQNNTTFPQFLYDVYVLPTHIIVHIITIQKL